MTDCISQHHVSDLISKFEIKFLEEKECAVIRTYKNKSATTSSDKKIKGINENDEVIHKNYENKIINNVSDAKSKRREDHLEVDASKSSTETNCDTSFKSTHSNKIMRLKLNDNEERQQQKDFQPTKLLETQREITNVQERFKKNIKRTGSHKKVGLNKKYLKKKKNLIKNNNEYKISSKKEVPENFKKVDKPEKLEDCEENVSQEGYREETAQRDYEGVTVEKNKDEEAVEEMHPMEYSDLLMMMGKSVTQNVNDNTETPLVYLRNKRNSQERVEELRRKTQSFLKKNQKEFIVQELIETEKYYIDNLEYLIEHYLKFMEHKFKEEKKLATIRLMSQIIHEKSQNFLKDLEDLQIDIQGYDEVGAVFLKNKDLFVHYPDYYKYQKYVEDLMGNKTQNDFMKKRQEDLGDNLGLYSYINTPVQRLTRYRLLLEELKKCMKKEGLPYRKVNGALKFLKEELQRGNDLVLLDSIKGNRPLISDTGRFLRNEKFYKLRPNKKMDVDLFAFERIIIIASPRKNSDNFDFICSINVVDLKLGFQKNDLKITFQDTGKDNLNIFTLKCSDEKIEKDWYSFLTEVAQNSKERKNESPNNRRNHTAFQSQKSGLHKKTTKLKKSSTITTDVREERIPKEDFVVNRNMGTNISQKKKQFIGVKNKK